AWLAGTSSGLQTLAELAVGASAGRLQIAGADGRLLGPLRITSLRWNSPDLQLQLDELRADWSPGALLHGHLHIAELQAERLLIEVSGSHTATPPPADLALPLTLDIDNIALSRLEYGNVFMASQLGGQLHSDGSQHRLDAFRATLGSVGITGQATLGASAPLALAASAEISGQLEDQPLAVSLQAAGPLEKVALEITARQGLQGEGKLILTPFAQASFANARLRLDDVDPARWQAGAPSARLQLRADLAPSGDGVAGDFSLSNGLPGPLDQGRLPLVSVAGQLDWPGATARLDKLRARLPGGGELSGQGRWQAGALQLELGASRLDAAQIVSRLRPTRLAGPLSAILSSQRQELKLDLQDSTFRLQAEAAQSAGRLSLPRLELTAGPARLSAKGELALDKNMAFSAAGELSHFDPSRFARLAAAEINASFTATGKLAPQPLIDGNFALKDSRWAGQPLSGQGRLKVDWPNIPLADIQLQAGANRLTAKGAFGRPGDSLAVDLEAPQLAPYGLEGGINGHLEVGGDSRQAQLSARLQATRLGLPGQLRLNGMNLTLEAGGTANSPLRLDLDIATLETPEQPGLLRQIRLHGAGTNQTHRLTASADLAGRNHLSLVAEGGLFDEKADPLWRGQLVQGEMQAADQARNFKLTAPATLQVARHAWRLGPAQLAGQPLDWQATLQAEADQHRLRSSLRASGSRLGQIEGSLEAGLRDAWSLDRATPWQGTLSTEIADLGWLAELLGEQWQSAGHFSGNLKLAGTPDKPLASGRLRGEKLALRLPEQGLHLANGELDIELTGRRLRVVKLAFDSLLQPLPRPLRLVIKEEAAKLAERPGRLEISGEMPIDRQLSTDQAFLDVHLERLGAWQLPDQWVAVSGDGRLTWRDNTLGASGKLAVDAGYWQLAKGGTPQLSDDVVIRRPAGEKPAASLRPKLDIDITSELGRNFLFTGAGLSARLAGDIRLRASGRDLPRASGRIRAVDGRFDAYGQQLAIERGILTFQGLLDNPALDVRAVRPGLAVEPGVQISGTARKPIIKLISDPELPDAEKLAWLVLGHGPEQMGAGDASLLFSAAGGLLGNDSGGLVQQLKKRFGFDELGVRTGQIGDLGGRQPGSRIAGGTYNSIDSTGQQIFSVGKRLSSKAMLSYEQALGKAESIVKLTVSLSQRVSVVGRAGSDNAIDLFYTFTFGRDERRPQK
ncbi:MAG: translocation/assembly module TamB domain-containing protein, partial [Azonexus sp.]